jgi:hypothetical protein
MPKKLVPLTPALFQRLETSWRKDAEACDLDFDSSWAPHLRYASSLVTNPKDRYWIYALSHVDASDRIRPPFDRIVHVNLKLPKTPHAEVRFVWSHLSPHLAAQKDLSTAPDQVADYMIAAMATARKDHNCKALRLYLPDKIDHQAAQIFAKVIGIMGAKVAPSGGKSVAKLEVRVVGQWLLLKM